MTERPSYPPILELREQEELITRGLNDLEIIYQTIGTPEGIPHLNRYEDGIDLLEKLERTIRIGNLRLLIQTKKGPELELRLEGLREDLTTHPHFQIYQNLLKIRELARLGTITEAELQESEEDVTKIIAGAISPKEEEEEPKFNRMEQITIETIKGCGFDNPLSGSEFARAVYPDPRITLEQAKKRLFPMVTRINNKASEFQILNKLSEVKGKKPEGLYYYHSIVQEAEQEVFPINLALTTRENPQVSKFLTTIPSRTALLVEKFFDSSFANWILAKIKEFQPENEEEYKDFKIDLVGAIFEQLGFHFLVEELKEPGIFVLAPQEVYELYKAMFPRKSTVNFRKPFLNFGIQGITLADSLIIRETEELLILEGVVDYKLLVKAIPKPEEFAKQLEYYRYSNLMRDFLQGEAAKDPLFHGRILNQIRPEIPVKQLSINANLKIIYGLPENSPLLIPAEDIVVQLIPVDSRDFGMFINLLIEAVKPSSVLTTNIPLM